MRIAIKGVGWRLPDIQPAPQELEGRSIPTLVHQAVKECVGDACVTMTDIDAIVTASVDLWDGKTASNIAVTEAVGAVMRAETRIAGDGLLALMHGAMMLLSGHYRRVLVVAHGKCSEADVDAVSNWSFDPVYQQTLHLTDAQALALQSQAVAARAEAYWGAKNATAFLCAVAAGNANDKLAPQGDGACAVILEPGDGGITLSGFGYDLDAHYLGDRDLSRSEGLLRATRRACRMASLDNPKREITHHYWSLRTGWQLPLWAEAVGSWAFAEGPTGLQSGRHHVQWAGLPPFAAGLQRLITAVKELRENPGTGYALAQGCHGPAGQAQAVCLLRANGGA
ncbi:MAG: hypothetical protein HS110_15350 [Zoogloeaceae bacterium]|nr:hypothetical protein [Zoogloeaceae bacterium]